MAKLPLTFYPTKSLQEPSRQLSDQEVTSDEIRQLIDDLAETMHAEHGIGLAAPQVGNNICVAIVHSEDGIVPLINPKVTKRSWRKKVDTEGCLSIPGVFGEVRRPWRVTVITRTVDGGTKEFRVEGMLARVMQHEIDHLNGVLFIDYKGKITDGQERLEEYEAKA